MIFETATNSNPMVLNGMATKVNGNNIKVPTDAYSPDFCYCMHECNTTYPVWGGGTDWQNDKTTFLFKRQIASDTGVFTIWKDGEQVATITDNTYGAWTSAYTSESLQYSYIADWNLIYNGFGYGTYQIKNSYTSIGVAKVFESRTFLLTQFDDTEANGWIKFDWEQQGTIESSDFDFTDIIPFSYKIQGFFADDNPETIGDNYATSSREINQFRIEQKNKYTFTSKFIEQTDYLMINENLALSNKVVVTDCNLFGTNYREKEFKFTEINNFTKNQNKRLISLNIQFEDYEQNIIKTNC